VRVLLDECLPRDLALELPGHEVWTVPQAGWASIANGALLRLAVTRFDVFVTIDARLDRDSPIPPALAVITLEAMSNRIEHLRPLSSSLRKAIETARPGDRVRVRAPG
jgi:hypothetical protein